MARLIEDKILMILGRVGFLLDIPVDRADVQLTHQQDDYSTDDVIQSLKLSTELVGIFLGETVFRSVDELFGFVREEFPVIVAQADGTFFILEKYSGNSVLASVYSQNVMNEKIGRGQLKDLIQSPSGSRFFVCKRQFECSQISSATDRNGHHHGHLKPFRRFIGLLWLDARDIWTITLFALVAGILTLATPLAVESLVNVVSWGIYLQPLVVLGMILFVCLGLAGTLQVLQTIVVEVIQRRQFVRIVGDLAHRFPRATAKSLEGVFPREFANRFFDIMTIQKASAALLLDGISVVLTTAMGMALLGFYHPFLLGFDIVLLFCMIIIVWAMGRGGIRTAIDESVEKYRVAHWLQDVIASPLVFKYQGGEGLAVHRANQLTVNYIRARESQFAVVIRQVASSIALYVIASTVLLALGGWLVINGQLTLGQLVASELVVTVVVGAFVKGGKAIEKFYDLMGGIDKVGHLLDMPTDILHEMSSLPPGPAEISWSPLQFSAVAVSTVVPAMTISAGSVVAIVGDDSEGRIFLSQCLGGLIDPASGEIQMGGFNLSIITRSLGNPLVCFASNNDLFHGTVRENVELGRSNIGLQKVRDALHRVGLDEVLLKLPDGVQTELQTHGYPLTDLQARRIVLARAIVVEPKLLVIDRLLDDLSDDALDRVWQALSGENRPWTLVINTNRHDIASMCDSRIVIQNES